jgi:hypothetical protein
VALRQAVLQKRSRLSSVVYLHNVTCQTGNTVLYSLICFMLLRFSDPVSMHVVLHRNVYKMTTLLPFVVIPRTNHKYKKMKISWGKIVTIQLQPLPVLLTVKQFGKYTQIRMQIGSIQPHLSTSRRSPEHKLPKAKPNTIVLTSE